MEVHHHTQSERKKWTHYLWEFLMLFLAVTLGFLVENKREHSLEHKRMIRYAKQLVRGLQKDTAQQNNMIILVLDDKEKAFDSLLYFLSLSTDDSVKWKGVYRNAWGLENPFRYTYQKPVFDQINYSGSLRLFTNDILIDSLMDYIYNGTLIDLQLNAEIDYISQTIAPFMNRHFAKNLIDQRFDTHVKRPGWEKSQIGHVIPSGLLKNVSDWKAEFENIVITAREKFELPRRNIIEERDRANILISSLKREFHID